MKNKYKNFNIMKNLFRIIGLVLTFSLLMSCEKEESIEFENQNQEIKVDFTLLPPEVPQNNAAMSFIPECSSDEPIAMLVVVQKEGGHKIGYGVLPGGSLKLPAGNYTVTDAYIFSNNGFLGVVPQENSLYSDYVNQSVPFNLTVEETNPSNYVFEVNLDLEFVCANKNNIDEAGYDQQINGIDITWFRTLYVKALKTGHFPRYAKKVKVYMRLPNSKYIRYEVDIENGQTIELPFPFSKESTGIYCRIDLYDTKGRRVKSSYITRGNINNGFTKDNPHKIIIK